MGLSPQRGLDASPEKVAENSKAISRGRGIASDAHWDTARAEAGLALLFKAGTRASADDVERHFARSVAGSRESQLTPGQHSPYRISAGQRDELPARISSQRGRADGWLELLASGLTFDLVGLAPGPALPVPQPRHYFGLPRDLDPFAFECIVLRPGPHLAGAGAMVPVVRIMAVLASQLARGMGALALCWQPAASWMDAQYFARIVDGWSAGGAFPALGLTGIERTDDGGVVTDGLAWFIGQELRVEPRSGEAASDTVKLAVRMIDHLVREGPVAARATLSGPGGEALLADPSADGRLLRLRRDA